MEQSNKLLITLGDSWTLGVGCSEEYVNREEPYRFNETVSYGCSWPSIIKEKLNFTHLLNVAEAGGSNSATVKRFVEQVMHKEVNKQFSDVTVIFLLTSFERFSFYSQGAVKSCSINSMHPNDNIPVYDNFLNWYINLLKNGDAERETIFYLDVVDVICKLYGYKFYWGTAFSDVQNIFNISINSSYTNVKINKENCLHYGEFNSFREYLVSRSKKIPCNSLGHFDYGGSHELFAPCGHPNDAGYELMAEYIINKLQQNNK